MSLVGGTLGKVVAVLVAGLVLTTMGIGAALTTGVVQVQQPTVESVENEWGTVTAETTPIVTTVVVNNPNGVGIPGVAGVSYDVRMNDVTVASGGADGVSLSPGRNEVAVRTEIDNDDIPAWWASHVNNGERTTVSVRPTVKAPLLSQALPGTNRTFETDLLSAFRSEQSRSVAVGGETLLVMRETEASWGHATAEETPLSFSATVENPGDEPLSFSRIGYEVTMNDVRVANGTTDDGVSVPAGETETIAVNATFDNAKLDEWWVSHIRNDETTRLDVTAFAVVETDQGTRRVPLPFLGREVEFQTDVLGGGATETRAVESGGDVAFEPVTVESVSHDWTATGDGSDGTGSGDSDASTRFESTVVVNNPNEPNATGTSVGLDATYRVTANDVVLVNRSTSTTLDSGANELAFAGPVPDSAVERWWVSHVESGEQTTLRTEADVTGDLGFARVPVDVADRETTVTTNVLGDVSDAEQPVTIDGREVGRLSGLSTEWGDATTERTPMVLTGDLRNDGRAPLTVVAFGYQVTANDVTLADTETSVNETVAARSTGEIRVEAALDTGQVPAWWASHLANDGVSQLSVDYYVVVEYRGEQFNVALDALSDDRTVETGAVSGG